MNDLALKRQQAWEAFIQKRTKNANQYAELISKESNSPYAPMREYVLTLPKTFEEVVPSFFIPMEEALQYPEQAEQEIARYNEIVARVNAITVEMLEAAEQEVSSFDREVRI